MFFDPSEALQEGEREGLDTVQAFTVSAHRHSLVSQRKGAEAEGEAPWSAVSITQSCYCHLFPGCRPPPSRIGKGRSVVVGGYIEPWRVSECLILIL